MLLSGHRGLGAWMKGRLPWQQASSWSISRFGKPLSGQGIIWAIDDAVAAMELLTRMEWRDLIQNMRARTANEVNAYCLERSRVYLSEQRSSALDRDWALAPEN